MLDFVGVALPCDRRCPRLTLSNRLTPVVRERDPNGGRLKCPGIQDERAVAAMNQDKVEDIKGADRLDPGNEGRFSVARTVGELRSALDRPGASQEPIAFPGWNRSAAARWVTSTSRR